jgi:hypothetical protein
MEIKYTDRIGKVLGTSAKKSDVLFSFPTQVEADPDHFAYYFIEDMGLYLAVFYEDKYDLELIDTRMPGLPDWPTDFVSLKDAGTGCKIIVNGPLFDAGECGLQPWYTRAKEYTLAALDDYTTGLYKGLVKGTLYLRNGLRASGECPIPDDPNVWRYYFAQRYTGVYEFKLGRLPTPDTLPVPPQPDGIAVAVEPLYGVFREGKRIGIGHEIDTDRQEPDSVFADKPIKQGIPIIGRCQKDGRIFLFVLMRPDSWFDPDVGSTWEQIVSLLRELQVIEAFITDGDDSVGLIIDDEVILEPGAKKNTLMPLAIGFKRRNP